jgi:hypothetical protein
VASVVHLQLLWRMSRRGDKE